MSEANTSASGRAVIASRGTVAERECRLLRGLPLRPMELITLGAQAEPARGIADVLAQALVCDDVAMAAIFEEKTAPKYLRRAAADAAAVLKKAGKPVLVAAGGYGAASGSNLLVAVNTGSKRGGLSGCRIDMLADPAASQIVVLSVDRPFWPVFSKTSVGMHASYGSAVREVHDSQIQDAAAEAAQLSEELRAQGAKSWAIGKVGRFASEARDTAESCNCALICVPVTGAEISRGRHIRSLLAELLECAGLPVLLLPESCM